MSNLETVATEAVFVLQYATNKAVHYITTRLPGVDAATAAKAVATAAKPYGKVKFN